MMQASLGIPVGAFLREFVARIVMIRADERGVRVARAAVVGQQNDDNCLQSHRGCVPGRIIQSGDGTRYVWAVHSIFAGVILNSGESHSPPR